MTSNRFLFVDRERVHGTIEGHDFGYNMSVLARSPEAVLAWSSGTSYTSGRETKYGCSTLYGFPYRGRIIGGWLEYERIFEGGRLSLKTIEACKYRIDSVFHDDLAVFDQVKEAVRQRKTLLIEGGGPPLMPDRSLGEKAYSEWRSLPVHGFINPQVTPRPRSDFRDGHSGHSEVDCGSGTKHVLPVARFRPICPGRDARPDRCT